jgi:hypothetical protein
MVGLSHIGSAFVGRQEGRGWKFTINICTFVDIENMHVMSLQAATEREAARRLENGLFWWMTL